MKNTRYGRAFTLVELLVVISIISLLAAVVLSNLSVAEAKARDTRRTEDMVQFRDALELYASNHGNKYPTVPPNEAFTSAGPVSVTPGVTIACPFTGTYWTSGDSNFNNAGTAFVQSMSPYLSTLPTDPLNGPVHCYIYVSSPIDGAGSDTAVMYDSALELAPAQLAGIVVGNTAGYTNTTYAPSLTTVLGVGGPPQVASPLQMSATPSSISSGQATTVSWAVPAGGASSCHDSISPSISPDPFLGGCSGGGCPLPNGSFTVHLAQTTAFSLTCTINGTSVPANVSVTVGP